MSNSNNPERVSSFAYGGTRWLLQRLTAAFLVVVLAFHFFLLHFAVHAPEITFAGSHFRMQQLGYLVTMVLFLATATFHGTNGIYNALVNQGIEGTQKQAAKWILVVASLLLFVQGARVAWQLTVGF
ncbi:succinate dehydrogenase hydrophobic membrane anchor subunit [Halocalculus aciditolerans]|uniref:Succinate dehydrogenase n=1 Tax=Halocalculus aciditolerans TaxID=1383812 RepID=A0A830FJT0_9EURY|nr:succinate dehydrogenase hydrophobic membrane anchor subunit [Halocalculus aciditolerans]GGL53676.1 succinate dehydrogenase [Halocalculus aciditolerans]